MSGLCGLSSSATGSIIVEAVVRVVTLCSRHYQECYSMQQASLASLNYGHHQGCHRLCKSCRITRTPCCYYIYISLSKLIIRIKPIELKLPDGSLQRGPGAHQTRPSPLLVLLQFDFQVNSIIIQRIGKLIETDADHENSWTVRALSTVRALKIVRSSQEH